VDDGFGGCRLFVEEISSHLHISVVQGGPKKTAHPSFFHSDGVSNNQYGIKHWFYWYIKIFMNSSM